MSEPTVDSQASPQPDRGETLLELRDHARQSYLAYLDQHGLPVDYLTMSEYARKRLNISEHDLLALSNESYECVAVAYEVQVVDRAEEIAENRALAAGLAAAKVIQEIKIARLPVAEAEIWRQENRIRLIEQLWIGNRWAEPWTNLINQEFPGEGPTDEDIEQFIKRAPEELMMQQHAAAERGELVGKFRDVLVAHAYPAPDSEQASLSVLAYLKQISRYQSYRATELADELQQVMMRTSYPQHPAWQRLTGEYF